jgi:ankyrin repeat protein
LAASAGALAAMKCLIDLGAYILRKDAESNNVIHLSAMRFHTNILEFFIRWNHPDVQVWETLVGKNRIVYILPDE